MDISARAISLADRPHWAIGVTTARTRREDRSSISSHPLADLGGLEASNYIIALLIGRLPRFSSPRSSGHEQERSRRCGPACWQRSEEHTSELQSQSNLVCRLLLEKKKN